MSAFPNPLANIANSSLRPPLVERRSRHEQTDPQLGILLDQKAQERHTLIFKLHVLEKQAGQAIQGILSSQPIYQVMEARHAKTSPQESPEMRWLVENRSALEPYHGEWLLIANNILIVHSAVFSEIRKAIADRNIRSPFVYYVPREEESNFIAF